VFLISIFVAVSSVPVNHAYRDTKVTVYISPEVAILQPVNCTPRSLTQFHTNAYICNDLGYDAV